MELILIDALKVAVCNTAKFGFEPIPSNYWASIAATNTNPDNPWYLSKQLMYFHVGDSGIFLYRCKITPALNSPHAVIGDCIGRQPNVSCVSYGLLLVAESCGRTTTEQCSGSEEKEEPSVSCKTAFSQTRPFFVETGGELATTNADEGLTP